MPFTHHKTTPTAPFSPSCSPGKGAFQSRIPIRSNSLPSFKRRITVSNNQGLEESIPSAHVKSLSDSLPRFPRMSLRSLFFNRSKIPLPRRHTSNAALHEDDDDYQVIFDETVSGRTHIPDFYPSLTTKNLELNIPRLSIMEDMQFPGFSDGDSDSIKLPIMKSLAHIEPLSYEEPIEMHAMFEWNENQDEMELTEAEEQDVMLMRDLILGNVQLRDL